MRHFVRLVKKPALMCVLRMTRLDLFMLMPIKGGGDTLISISDICSMGETPTLPHHLMRANASNGSVGLQQ
jgi:hypothetical protein